LRIEGFSIENCQSSIVNFSGVWEMNSDELKKRTKEFAHRCVKLGMALPKNTLGNHIRGQLIRCSTSVAANYRAACIAQSKASFISKLSIVVEEADESCFWMEFIIDENLMDEKKVRPLLNEADQLKAIFITSRKTARD
jgi:four helix bundle protein